MRRLALVFAVALAVAAAGCRSAPLASEPDHREIASGEALRAEGAGLCLTDLAFTRCAVSPESFRINRWLEIADESGAEDQKGGADSAGGGQDLAKASQNPVSDLVSVPLQFNLNTGIGPNDREQLVTNIQPVVPIKLSSRWSLITRTILPVIRQPLVQTETQSITGIGDLNPTFFLTPAKPGKLIWGVGPSFVLPTETDSRLGTGKWSAGPGVVLLTMPGQWVIGVLATNVWSFAGNPDREDVNQFVCQYFLNYNFKCGGWYLTSSPIITANWKADAGDQWTVPFGLGVGKIFKLGPQPINANIGAYYNAVRPDGAAEWTFRFQWTFLFP